MFGLKETPTVNGGRMKVMLHLLSPGYKPVQVTQDLKSFWQTAYHEVRKGTTNAISKTLLAGRSMDSGSSARGET